MRTVRSTLPSRTNQVQMARLAAVGGIGSKAGSPPTGDQDCALNPAGLLGLSETLPGTLGCIFHRPGLGLSKRISGSPASRSFEESPNFQLKLFSVESPDLYKNIKKISRNSKDNSTVWLSEGPCVADELCNLGEEPYQAGRPRRAKPAQGVLGP